MMANTQFVVPTRVLGESEAFLRERGSEGLEAMALWAGEWAEEGKVVITRVVIPEQVAETTPWGARVDLTPETHYTLTDLLRRGEQYFTRIHSHPARAYHSARDDANQVLTHEGAISIVVPDFARHPIELSRCAIFRYSRHSGWSRLSRADTATTFSVLGDQ